MKYMNHLIKQNQIYQNTICDNITIDVYIPLELSEKMNNLYNELKDLGYDLFDIESPFYQDICTPYKSENILMSLYQIE